jgi:succinoglycan biosynthesis protein ExoO
MSVSVVIAAYNVQKCIPRAIESALCQTRPPQEIIVVDDGSSDNTVDIVKDIATTNSNIQIIALPENGGQARARNVAIQQATGDWIAILDADDAWRAGRLEHLRRIADEHEADFVADNLILYDHVAKNEVGIAFASPWKIKRIQVIDLFVNDFPEFGFNFGGLKPIIRRDFLSKNNIKYDVSLRYCEDFTLYAEILFRGGVALLTSEPLYIFGTRVGAVSRAASPYSRSHANFLSAAQAGDKISAKYSHLINEELRDVISRRRRHLMAIHGANVARDFRRSGRLHRYAYQVLRNPDVFALLLKRTYHRAMGRLGFDGLRRSVDPHLRS